MHIKKKKQQNKQQNLKIHLVSNFHLLVPLYVCNVDQHLSLLRNHTQGLFLPCCVIQCIYRNHSCLNLVKFLSWIYAVNFAIAAYYPNLCSQQNGKFLAMLGTKYSHCHEHVSYTTLLYLLIYSGNTPSVFISNLISKFFSIVLWISVH